MKNWLLPILAIGGIGAIVFYSTKDDEEAAGAVVDSGTMTKVPGGQTATWSVKKDGDKYYGYYQEEDDLEKVIANPDTGEPISRPTQVQAIVDAKNKLGGLGYVMI